MAGRYLYLFVILTNLIFGINNEITVNFSNSPNKFDYQFLDEDTEEKISEFLIEGLTRQDETGNSIPGIAEAWEVRDDGLVWTFHLRDAKWENGDPVTANDFKFAWLRALENKEPYRQWLLYPIKGARNLNKGKGKKEDVGVKVIDSKTLEVTLETPTEYFDSFLSQPITTPLNEKFYNIHKEKYGMNVENIISNGPYKLIEWSNEGDLELIKNKNYWAEKSIKIEKIKIKSIHYPSVLSSFEKGELDISEIDYDDYTEVKKNKNLNYYEDGSIWYLEYNLKNNFLSNKKIRQALTLAVDKEELSLVLQDVGKPAYGYVPSYIKGTNKTFREEAGDTFPHYNPEEARKLFAEGLKELGMDKAPKVSIIFNDAGNNKKIIQYVQEKIRKELGLELDDQSLSFKGRLSRMIQKDFDIILAGWSADYSDALSYMELWVTDGGNNHISYSNPKYDKLIKIGQTSPEQKTRIEAMIQAEKILGEDVPISVIFYKQRMILINPKLKGIMLKSFGNSYYLNNTY
ncbi:MAG: peptide ABC transporter substrate-binding protein [Sebaldella sp.]|nr:peptide ABC transporter substrate-binding protein [Sebaldella sp.]